MTKSKSRVQSSKRRRGPVAKAPSPCEVCLDPTPIQGRLCCSCYARVRRSRIKKAAVAYKGGICQDCGWTGHPVTFDFHHVADDKSFSISGAYCRSAKAIKAELDKCAMLCAICHRLRHATEESAVFQAEVERIPLHFEALTEQRERVCEGCGKPTSKASYRCSSCARRAQGDSLNWPSDGKLLKLLKSSNVNQVSKQLGVSYNGLKKHLAKIRGVGG